jgi:hypothetical protein
MIMRKIKKTAVIALFISTGFLMSNCFGSFELVRKVYDWNDGVSENKFVKTLLFYAMSFIPIYGIAVLVDVVILNLVEFWSGTNPLAMNEGESEEQLFAKNGTQYKMVATKNQFTVTTMSGSKTGDVERLRFDTENLTWYLESEENCLALMSFEGKDHEILRVHNSIQGDITYALNTDGYNGSVETMYTKRLDMSTFSSIK